MKPTDPIVKYIHIKKATNNLILNPNKTNSNKIRLFKDQNSYQQDFDLRSRSVNTKNKITGLNLPMLYNTFRSNSKRFTGSPSNMKGPAMRFNLNSFMSPQVNTSLPPMKNQTEIIDNKNDNKINVRKFRKSKTVKPVIKAEPQSQFFSPTVNFSKRLSTLEKLEECKVPEDGEKQSNNNLISSFNISFSKKNEYIPPQKSHSTNQAWYDTNKENSAENSRRIKKKYVLHFVSKSQAGRTENKRTKVNQDNSLISSNVLNLEDFNIFGVFDGHGMNGHHVSSFVSAYFTEYFKNETLYEGTKSNNDNRKKALSLSLVYSKLREKQYEIISNSFIQAEKELINSNFDAHFSGTTSVMVFIIGNKIICANVGDSRAIIVNEKKKKKKSGFSVPMSANSRFEVESLSTDHKPDLPSEKTRIINAGGRVEQYEDLGIPTGPYRVWLKSEKYPGLAMSRSIGDIIATSVGVTSEPEITEYEITTSTRYIIIASDGVWEFLDNNTVMTIVNPFYLQNDPEGAVNALISEATQYWEVDDLTIDDITVIAIFFIYVPLE